MANVVVRPDMLTIRAAYDHCQVFRNGHVHYVSCTDSMRLLSRFNAIELKISISDQTHDTKLFTSSTVAVAVVVVVLAVNSSSSSSST